MKISSYELDFGAFSEFCESEAKRMKRHNEKYLSGQLMRLYETLNICCNLISQRAKIFSVGAGGAYVEKFLKILYNAEVTVVDFPEAILAHAEDYARYGFHSIGLNLAADSRLQIHQSFDMVCSFEVVEHLPISPFQHLKSLYGNIKSNGYLLLSTPNLARIKNIGRLMRGQPILHDPRLVFIPANYKNEYIHRREYIEAEIVEAMTQASLVHLKTYYTLSKKPRYSSLRSQFLRIVYTLKPCYKPIMILVARKN